MSFLRRILIGLFKLLSNKVNILLILGVIIMRIMMLYSNSLLDTYYSNLIFLKIRKISDVLLDFIPFSFSMFLIVLVFVYLIYRILKYSIKLNIKFGFRFILIFIFMFYLMWGMNYARKGLVHDLSLKVENKDIDIFSYAKRVVFKLNRLKENNPNFDLKMFNLNVDQSYQTMISKLEYPLHNTPTYRLLKPRGVLLRFGTSGVYSPWTAEANIDSGLHKLEWPITIMHELGHSLGYTNEGECNLFGFMACIESEDPYFEYSAWLNLWFYIRNAVYKEDKIKYQEISNVLSDNVKMDIKSIINNGKKYPDVFPKLRTFLYDSYLKSNGVHDGIKSYNKIIILAHAIENLEK